MFGALKYHIYAQCAYFLCDFKIREITRINNNDKLDERRQMALCNYSALFPPYTTHNSHTAERENLVLSLCGGELSYRKEMKSSFFFFRRESLRAIR